MINYLYSSGLEHSLQRLCSPSSMRMLAFYSRKTLAWLLHFTKVLAQETSLTLHYFIEVCIQSRKVHSHVRSTLHSHVRSTLLPLFFYRIGTSDSVVFCLLFEMFLFRYHNGNYEGNINMSKISTVTFLFFKKHQMSDWVCFTHFLYPCPRSCDCSISNRFPH